MVGVAGEDDPRLDRDLLAGDPVRVARAVPALVLVAHRPRDRSHPGNRAEDPLADHRMLAHDLPLAVVQRPLLVEDLVGDPDLADVVQERRGTHAGDLRGIEGERLGDLGRQVDDGLGVIAGIAVALAQRGGERRDHVTVSARRRRRPSAQRWSRIRPSGRHRPRGPTAAPSAAAASSASGVCPGSSIAMPAEAAWPRTPPASTFSSEARMRVERLCGADVLGLRKHHGELVAADPAGEIVRAGAVGDRGRRPPPSSRSPAR